MKRGFTLIELSIVLVIIGLLIGRILIAKSMISSAKLNKQIQQLEQIEIAVNNFKTTYNELPGDTTKIGDTTGISADVSKLCAGNGNGKIEAIGDGSYGIADAADVGGSWLPTNGFGCRGWNWLQRK